MDQIQFQKEQLLLRPPLLPLLSPLLAAWTSRHFHFHRPLSSPSPPSPRTLFSNLLLVGCFFYISFLFVFLFLFPTFFFFWSLQVRHTCGFLFTSSAWPDFRVRQESFSFGATHSPGGFGSSFHPTSPPSSLLPLQIPLIHTGGFRELAFF